MERLEGLGLDEEIELEETKEAVATASSAAEKPRRRPFHYWTVRGREYRLKLNTSMIQKLENKYKCNMMNLVASDSIPPLGIMLTIIQAAMVPWEHGIRYGRVEELYDQYLEEGGSQIDLYSKVIMPTMAVSGFFTQELVDSMMKDVEQMDLLS